MLYLERLAPSSKQTMRYVLQDAADRLGRELARELLDLGARELMGGGGSDG